MTVIETRTTHTATLEWPYAEPLSKRELIHKLQSTIPEGADIVGMSVADVPRNKPGREFPKVMRALTITYVGNPTLMRYRMP